ncbi:MAG: sigma-70 family RNA polymerase sigma factor [Candidatus Omnitrophota bacterium]
MSDLEFVLKCVKGDKPVWEEFVDKYSRLIFNYINSVLKSKNINLFNKENTDDIFQEIFVLLRKDNFRKLRSFKAKNECSLASWLRQVTINYTIDYVRNLKPAISLEEDSGDEHCLKDRIADGLPLPSDYFFNKEKLKHLTDCIKKMSNDDKYFLELFINRGLSLEKIKGVLRVSRPAVDMRKARIIDRLKECFKSKGFVIPEC